MRKALIPMLASLALCGAGAAVLVISSANAQPGPHKPMMVAATTPTDLELAANDTPATSPQPDARRNLRRPSPEDMTARLKDICQDRVARQTGQLAYLETRLELTASQEPLFQHWKDAKLGIARRHAEQCAARPLPQRQAGKRDQTAQRDRNAPQAQNRADRFNPADRMAREEDRLKTRLADLQAERPALEAFANALSPEQKMQLAREDRRGGHERGRGMMRHSRFAQAMGPEMMNRGMMGRPPMGPPPQER